MPNLQTVLVTRAQPGAAKTARLLTQMGLLAEVLPAIQLTQSPVVFNEANYQGALIFTSQNGVQFSPRAPFRKAKKVFCVGDATARAAHEAGFKNIESAQGDAEALKILIQEQWKPEDGPLIHMGSDRPRGNIVPELKDKNYDARLLTVYKSLPAPTFEDQFRTRLKMDLKLDVILVHSPLAASLIDMALNDWSELSQIDLPKIIAISPDAGNPLIDLFNEAMFIAAKPNENSVLEQLKSLE